MPINTKHIQAVQQFFKLNSDIVVPSDPVVSTTLVSSVQTPPERPKRCQYTSCKTKLALSDFACQCKQIYCSTHRHAESHDCTFDYQGATKKSLEKQVVKVVGSTLNRI